MADLLIRDVPDHVVRGLDRRAAELGISRAELLRRQVARAASGTSEPVSVESLVEFGRAFADLADPEVMDQAWR